MSITPNDSMARPSPGTDFQGAWCEGCGKAIGRMPSGWVHLDPAAARCDPREIESWVQIRAGVGL